MNKRGLREQARQRERDKRRVASGENRERMRRRQAQKAGLDLAEYEERSAAKRSDMARRARALSARCAYRQHARLRSAVNAGRRYELFKASVLASYHRNPDNWSTRHKRRRLFERDGWRCLACGKLVTDQVKHGSPNRAVAGHILAKATGGDWSDENMATLCHPCNVADGVNRLPIQMAVSV